jgi:hypothetical protein
MALSYWLHFFRVLSTQADLTFSTNPQFYLFNPYFIGHHPFFSQLFDSKIATWFQQDYSANLLTFCLHSIESCYQQIAASQNKTGLKYFAEKLHRPTPTYRLQWSLYPQSHSVFIVRDFRDRYCSTVAFYEKVNFEFLLTNDLEEETAKIMQSRNEFMLCYDMWKQNPERVHLVRYEDLITHPRETLARLFAQMGLELDDILLDKLLADTKLDTQAYTEHRTTKSDADSIGRWRTELNPQLKTLYQTHFGDILSEFGYELS